MDLSTYFALARAAAAAALRTPVQGISLHLKATLWKLLSTPTAVRLSRLPFRVGQEAKRDKVRGRTWMRHLERTLNTRTTARYAQLVRQRIVLESALYHTEPRMIEMMRACAAKLAHCRTRMIGRGETPIFAPLHFCSDMVAATVAAMTEPYRSHVFSIYKEGYFGAAEQAQCERTGIAEFVQHHPDDPPSHFRSMVRDLRSHRANVVIFPDILPQFTNGYLGRAMRTRDVLLFGRPARLHSGAEELARMAGAKLVPFYIYWLEGKLEIRIFEPCANGDEVARCIERALRERGDQWLLWHFPSLFYFNDGSTQ
ncbi:hypothetical protein [Cupriavidus pauculus]|uniref:hypothetical protein n=1 Tax=Cupriavidus pauculus TaxID=82633 RepID=UPI003857253B